MTADPNRDPKVTDTMKTSLTAIFASAIIVAGNFCLDFIRGIMLRLYQGGHGSEPSLPLLTQISFHVTQPFALWMITGAAVLIVLSSEFFLQEPVFRLVVQLTGILFWCSFLTLCVLGLLFGMYILDSAHIQ